MADDSGLVASVAVGVGDLAVDVELRASNGRTVALIGPNGAGKTTLLRVVAGLARPARARVQLDGDVLEDTAGGVFVPPEQRPVGVVFQDGLLFPHLDALANVAFGLRARGVGSAEARRRAYGWLERLGVSDRASARPSTLSGGEAQRVALARALAVEPRLLLLDEPFAALDASSRPAVRRQLAEHLAGHEGPRVLVTHDPVEALALADELVVVEKGRVVQAGAPTDVAARPRSAFVADLVGVNLWRGTSRGGRVELEGFELAVPHISDGEVFVVVHPRAVALHRGPPEGSARNVWAAAVASVEPRDGRARVRLAGGLPLVAEVTMASVQDLQLAPGASVWASLKATEVSVYPA